MIKEKFGVSDPRLAEGLIEFARDLIAEVHGK